jgi:DNA-binding SARP family transcriptional activator/WD40 repeat protein
MVLTVEAPRTARLGASTVAALDYRVLGQFEVLAGGAALPLGGPKQRVVLAVLVAAAGRAVSVDSLLQAIYGEDAAPTSRATLQTYVSNLRQVLGGVIVRRGDGYLIDVTDSCIDAIEFEDACRAASSSSDPEEVSARLREALATWRGHPYADIEAHGLLDGEITRLAELRLAAIEMRITADLQLGWHREVIAELEALTIEHPYQESLRGLHMLALYRSGRQAEALRAFSRTREELVEGLGIEPSPDLQDLQRRILNQDRSLLAASRPEVHRWAVVVADVDDAGWPDAAERESAFVRRESILAAAAEQSDGVKLAPRGTAGYAIFREPIQAVQAARQVVDARTRVAVDFGDLEMREGEPVGPPLARAARLVAVAHTGQVLLSHTAHDALTAAGLSGWAAESLGRYDIIGLDPGLQIYQLVGRGFTTDFPDLMVDRLPPAVPGALERSIPGYELRALIGVGDVGEVHRAYEPSMGREVALRAFGAGVVGHPQFVRRFETALQRVARVEHPYVVPLLDYWREPSRAVTVSRLMTGGHLGQRIPQKGFGNEDAMSIFEAVASGVASAHRHGIAHGRIRPQNVLFDAEGHAFLADLGIDEICTGIVTFATGVYDAPERLGGALATTATDVYSLGILLYHLLGGSPPPQDAGLNLGAGAIDGVIARSVDADPQRRQRSVDELVAEVREALAVAAGPTSAFTPTELFTPTRNPYRGLAAFELADADDFHGRDRPVAEMVEVLRHERLLVVVGPSGIGKSSAVRAGLLSAVAGGALTGSEHWLITDMVPGREPFEQLAAALARVATSELPDVAGALALGSSSLEAVVEELAPGHAGMLIVIDQLEELFTQTTDETQRQAFLQMLVDIAGAPDANVRAVATLRADYFDRPLAHPGFDDAIQGRAVALGAMSSDELADAVRLPARSVGVEIDSGVVERIVGEAATQPGALPLVQHTLSELFASRSTDAITPADLDAIGGVSGAIGRRAEQIFQSLDQPGREAAEAVFLRLVSVSEEHGDTRRRVRRSELEQAGIPAERLDSVLGEYGRYRLLTFDRDRASRTPTVELAHEALITDWARLREWVDDAREDLLARRRLESAAQEWVDAGTDASFLFSGGRLEVAEALAASTRFRLGDDERRFLAAGREAAERSRIVRARRRRWITGVLAGAAVVALVLAGVAFVQGRDASRQAAIAEEQRQSADRQRDQTRAGELAGLSLLAIDEDPELAILLGLAALERTDEPSAELLSALHRATQATRVRSTITGEFSSDIVQRADGSMIAAVRADRSGFVLIDPSSGTTVSDVTTADEISEYGLAFDPTGSTLAVAESPDDESGAAVELFDVDSGRRIASLPGVPGQYYCCTQFDPSGRWLGGLDLEGAVVWDATAGGPPASFGPAYDFELAPDGTSIVVGIGSKLTISDIATGRRLREVDTPAGVEYWDFELDSTGTLAALVSRSEFARRVDVVAIDSGDLRATIDLRDPLFAQFSPDGRLLAVSAEDSIVRLYDTDRFAEVQQLAGTPGPPSAVMFSPDGTDVTAAGSGEIRIWDITPSGPRALGNFMVEGGPLDRLVVSADESTAYASVYTDSGLRSSIRRIDLATAEDDELFGDMPFYFSTRPLVSGDTSVMAKIEDDFVSTLLRLPNGGSTRLGQCESVRAFDADGRVAAVDSHLVCEERGEEAADASRIIDVDSGDTILDLPDTVIYAAAFGRPGDDGLPQVAAVVDRDSAELTVYDLTTGSALGSYAPDAWPASIALSRDGGRLALLLDTGRLVVLDVARVSNGDGSADPVLHDIVAHAAGSKAVAFSSGGLIATGSSLDGVRIWSRDGELLANVPTRQADTPTFAFASGTDTLYYEDADGLVRRFEIDRERVTQLARSVLTRGFTPQECARYFPGEACPVVAA